MAKTEDEVPATWNELADGDEQRLGVSKDVLRKLMQMNPNLRGNQSTEDVLRQVKSQLKRDPSPKSHDVGEVVLAAKAGYEREMQRIDVAIKHLQEERAAFGDRTCEKLVEQCLRVDPGMSAPPSQQVLQQEKPFLDKIGFTVAKVAQRQKSLRKQSQ